MCRVTAALLLLPGSWLFAPQRSPLAALAEPDVAERANPNPRRVKVYILAGQSNMVGHADVKVMRTNLEHGPDQYRDLWTPLVHNSSATGMSWVEFDDVSIRAVRDDYDSHGKLTVGYGSKGVCIGPELGFGVRMHERSQGDAQQGEDQPHVLIIKASWGGRSLYKDFKSPSTPLPNDVFLEQDCGSTSSIEACTGDYGEYYRNMMDVIRDTLDNVGSYVSESGTDSSSANGGGEERAIEPELAGFVWFQGWNDQYSEYARVSYEGNMVQFIQDVRADLQAPNLPFVIGVLGVEATSAIAEAQRRAGQDHHRVLGDSVAVVETHELLDQPTLEAFSNWTQDPENWARYGCQPPYHYYGSPRFFYLAGRAFAEAALSVAQ